MRSSSPISRGEEKKMSVFLLSGSLGMPPVAWEKIIGIVVTNVVAFFLVRYALTSLSPFAEEKKACGQGKKKKLTSCLGRRVDTDAHENIICSNLVLPDEIDVTFDSIGGLEDQKRDVHDMLVLPLSRPELFTGRLLNFPKGVLLYGPPGCGKTMLAKAVAKEARASFINVSVATLMNKWYGESEKLVEALFSLAQKIAPTIVFIDEIDSFLGERSLGDHQATTNMKALFMTMWDGLLTLENSRVVVMAASNRPWDVDRAILRRLPRAFFIDLPDETQRKEILRVILRDEYLEQGFDYDAVVAATKGYSGSDLKELSKMAAVVPVHEFMERERAGEASLDLRPLRTADLLEACENIIPTGESSQAFFTKCTGRPAGTSLADFFRDLQSKLSDPTP